MHTVISLLLPFTYLSKLVRPVPETEDTEDQGQNHHPMPDTSFSQIMKKTPMTEISKAKQ
jgi:hypothetical protein